MSVEALSSSSRIFNTYFVFGRLFLGQPDTNYLLLSIKVNLHAAPRCVKTLCLWRLFPPGHSDSYPGFLCTHGFDYPTRNFVVNSLLIRLSEPRPADLDSVALAKLHLHSVVMKSYRASGSVRSHSLDSSSLQTL